MRVSKRAICALSMLAMASSVMAVSVDPGPAIIHVTSRDSGTVYLPRTPGATGTFDADSDELIPLPSLNTKVDGEDMWGIFKIDTIQNAFSPGPNQVVGVTGIQFADADGDRELVGMFWGGNDVSVTIADDGSQTISSVGVNFAIWEQEWDTYNDGLPGTSARVGPAEYSTIGHNATSTLWLTGKTQVGFLGGSTEFRSNFDPTAVAGQEAGDGIAWISLQGIDVDGDGLLDVGSMNSVLDTNFFTAPGGETADMSLQITTYGNNPTNTPAGQPYPPGDPRGSGTQSAFDWTVTDSDPIGIYAIPEPLTMGAFGLAFAGLGGYIKKRNRKA